MPAPTRRQPDLPSAMLPAVDVLSEIYNRRFFSEYASSNEAYAGACACIAEELARRFQPRTAVDWGCGTGLHAAALAACGIEVTAVDGVRPDQDLLAPNVDVRIADLTQPLPDNLVTRPYDLSLCIDVMEHLFERDATQALTNVTDGASIVILSCAPPGQGGHHHVNEQPRRYWVKRMAEMGWRYDRRETGAMERYFMARREQVPLSWMYHNLCVYRPA